MRVHLVGSTATEECDDDDQSRHNDEDVGSRGIQAYGGFQPFFTCRITLNVKHCIVCIRHTLKKAFKGRSIKSNLPLQTSLASSRIPKKEGESTTTQIPKPRTASPRI